MAQERDEREKQTRGAKQTPIPLQGLLIATTRGCPILAVVPIQSSNHRLGSIYCCYLPRLHGGARPKSQKVPERQGAFENQSGESVSLATRDRPHYSQPAGAAKGSRQHKMPNPTQHLGEAVQQHSTFPFQNMLHPMLLPP